MRYDMMACLKSLGYLKYSEITLGSISSGLEGGAAVL
jgi:hypothetical protein